MLCEHSNSNSESLAQIRTTLAKIRYFLDGIVFYCHTLKKSCHEEISHLKKLAIDE